MLLKCIVEILLCRGGGGGGMMAESGLQNQSLLAEKV